MCEMKWDKLGEECGVIGLYTGGAEQDQARIASMACYGLIALQHRGQESAGIAVKNDSVKYYKDMGLVQEVFNNDILSKLHGKAAIGHVRYSTTGDSNVANAQPLVVKYRGGSIALGHPFGATGARMTLTLANELALSGRQFALMGICAAGGLGAAAVLEAVPS